MNSCYAKRLLAVAVASLLTLPAMAAPADLPPVEAFFQNVEMGGADISPNGRYVLARSAFKGTRRSLALIDLATMTSKILARYSNGDVGTAFWLNDKRIGFTVINIDRRVVETSSGLYAIDLDGGASAGLAEAVFNQRSFADGEDLPSPSVSPGVIRGHAPRLSDAMFTLVHLGDDTTLGSLNTRTGVRSNVRAPDASFSWLIDDNGLRLVMAADGDQHAMHLLGADRRWRKLASFAPSSPAALLPNAYINNTLYVQARNGQDQVSLYRYNSERTALDQPALMTAPGFDLEPQAVSEGKRLLGFRINTDAESTVWFDPDMKALQAEIDAMLPQTVNRVRRGTRSETPFVLVQAYSPVHPGSTLVYNRDTKKLTGLGSALPAIDPAQMANSVEMVRYPARDGMSIPAYVTLPKAAQQKKLPTIIMAGAHPWMRNGTWSFDPAVQFLASRGYAVIQPDARGARGFGAAHFKAGHKQWGLAMQDDLADGAKWAIAQGIADPNRICILGTVYGGYAALMGVIKEPELFRCAVSWAGIVDLKLMFKHSWEQKPNSAYGDDMRALVGDPYQDAAQFDATSPLHNARLITRPVLLAYGDKDVEVPGKHGRQLYDAIKPGNPNAELIMFDEQGQPPSLEKNRAELWTRIEQFLARHIGKPSP